MYRVVKVLIHNAVLGLNSEDNKERFEITIGNAYLPCDQRRTGRGSLEAKESKIRKWRIIV